jgi:DNA mismatch repair protein MutS2
MKRVKHTLQESRAFQYMMDALPLLSSAGKKRLLEQPFLTSPAEIEKEGGLTQQALLFIEKHDSAPLLHALSELRDLHGTLSLLSQGAVLDDIDLFEVKRFALSSERVTALLSDQGAAFLEIPGLAEVVETLDPEGQGIPQFYIYSAYTPRLAEVRVRMKAGEDLRGEEQAIEDEIREALSARLRPWADRLSAALEMLAHLDLLIAKARQAREMGLCKAEISSVGANYLGLFNPAEKAFLEKENKRFQAVDIELTAGPTLVTGANMGGKTVLLKTLHLAQCLFQHGFFAPAQAAAIAPVEELFLSCGDEQSEQRGLSSFAFEMKNINRLVEAVKSGKKTLALIDELARTTNPDEGKAIVRAVLDFLQEYGVCSVVTTHYGGIESDCRKLRVKGLMTESIEGKIRFERLNELMDYSLVEADGAGPVSEGIRIAEILGVDEELIEKAKWYFEKDNN